MKPRDQAIADLKQNGYFLKRNGSNHDIYFNDQTKSIIPLKRHDFDENDLQYIRKEIKHNHRRFL